MADWYDRIEEPLRDLVRYLRSSGVNTECSCGHERYIQCQAVLDGQLKDLHDLMYSWFYSRKESVDFEIEVSHKVADGTPFTSLDIKLPGNPSTEELLERDIQHHEKMMKYHERMTIDRRMSLRRPVWTPPTGIDPECIKLSAALNTIPGVETKSSCSGHGYQPFQIWFDITGYYGMALAVLNRFVSARYISTPFKLHITDKDVPPYCTWYLEGPPGCYEEADSLAEKLAQWRKPWYFFQKGFAERCVVSGNSTQRKRKEKK